MAQLVWEGGERAVCQLDDDALDHHLALAKNGVLGAERRDLALKGPDLCVLPGSTAELVPSMLRWAFRYDASQFAPLV